MSKPDTWKSWEDRTVDGKFALRQFLGSSDHSAVFLTELKGPRAEKAAIKLIEPEPGEADRQLLRLRATVKLSHPHLIQTIDAGKVQMDGGTVLYVVMENADEDLSQILPQRALESGEMADLLPPVIDALSYLHGQTLVHGRIKPSNVLAVGNQLKLSSDQVASVAEQNTRRRRRDVYDAPETAMGIISSASDVWSVGATIVAALTQNATLAEETAPGSRGLPETIPEPFRGIARECLHLDPKRRCSLAQIQARMQPAARSVPAFPEAAPVPKPPSGRRPVFGVTLALVVIVAIVGAVLYSRGNKNEAHSAEPTSQPAAQPIAQPASQPAASSASSAAASQPSAPAQPEPPKPAAASPGSVTHQVIPDVPRSAQNTITGTIKVTVRVEVDPSGKVTSAKFKSTGSSRYFANLAMKAAQRWEFSAPVVDGQPAASTWLLQFRFKRTSIQASSQRVTR